MSKQIDFRHAPTLDKAAMSPASFRCVEGPVNSGKSVWSASEIYAKACTIPRCLDGVRRSKFIITRNTYPELEDATIKTWLMWFPESVYGKLEGKGPYRQMMEFSDVQCEVVFRSFDPSDILKAIKAMRSTEWTGAWANECQYQPLPIIKELYSRTGRYPSSADCPDWDRSKWMVADMNAPDVAEHWSYLMRGKTPIPYSMSDEEKYQFQCPEDWEFFEQPPSVLEERDVNGKFVRFVKNPDIENFPYTYKTDKNLYQELSGRSTAEVRRDLMNKVVPIRKGYPRYSQFNEQLHVGDIEPLEGAPIIAGYDPGLNGAIHLAQRPGEQWMVMQTILANGDLAVDLAERTLKMLNMRFPWWKSVPNGFVGWGDPFGGWRGNAAAKAEQTAFDIFRARGMRFRPPKRHDNPSLRHEIGKKVLTELTNTGAPKMLIDGRYCRALINALDGGMTMKEVKSPDGLKVVPEVDKKNPLADVGEAWEYMLWGGGEGAAIMQPPTHESAAKHIKTLGKTQRARFKFQHRR